MKLDDLKKLKSVTQHKGESKILELLYDGDEKFKRAHPLSHARGLSGTELKDAGGTVVVSKRGANVLAQRVEMPQKKLAELAELRGFEWAGETDRTIPYWASDDRRDRHGDRVLQQWNMTEFEQNPIMLDSHNWTGLTIGGVLDWGVKERTDGPWTGDSLHLLGLFADADTYPFADTVYRLAKAGFMRAGSVGFFPDEVFEVRDAKERKQLDLGETGLIFGDNRLIEWSPCAVPCHPGAGVQLNALARKGLFKPCDVQPLRQLARRLNPSGESDAELLAMTRLVFPDARIPDDVDEEDITEKTFEGYTKRGFVELLENLTNIVHEKLAYIVSVVDDLREANNLPVPEMDVPLDEESGELTGEGEELDPDEEEDDEEDEEDEDELAPDEEEDEDEDAAPSEAALDEELEKEESAETEEDKKKKKKPNPFGKKKAPAA